MYTQFVVLFSVLYLVFGKDAMGVKLVTTVKHKTLNTRYESDFDCCPTLNYGKPLKLRKEPHVIFKEAADIIDAVF
jgi:hypothetical protein